MKNILLIACLCLVVFSGKAQESNWPLEVQSFIEIIKNNDVEKLSAKVIYPLRRELPLASIKNGYEFQKNYEILFDVKIRERIVNSNLETDWSVMGAKGIMFGNGEFWLSEDGLLMALNYQSEKEAALLKAKLAEQKQELHASVELFLKPAFSMETRRFKIRIDEMQDGSYRYASWGIANETTQKPDLVLKGGKMNFDGSGGNHFYSFKNGAYTYRVNVFVLGAKETPEAELNVFKGDRLLVQETAVRKEERLPLNEAQLLIQESRVGVFKIGDVISNEAAEAIFLNMRKEIQTRYTEEGPEEAPYFVVSYKAKDLLKLKPTYDHKRSAYTNTIGEITILSHEFQTKEKVGVGTTIHTFSQKYPKYELWYTYISDMYVIDTPEMKVQFLLRDKDFVGKMSFDSDMTILKKADFREGAQIKEIRLF